MFGDGKSGIGTKLRLIEAAAGIFAEKGYRDATVAEICSRADANIAAVNYHFRSKEGLYEAVWDHLMEVVEERYPLPGPDVTSEEALTAFIRHRVLAIFDEGKAGWLPRILHRQLATRSSETERLVEKHLLPRLKRFDAAIASLLRKPIDCFAVRACSMSIHSQLVMLNVKNLSRHRLFGRDEPTPEQIEELIEHIVEFTLGGIARVAEGRE